MADLINYIRAGYPILFMVTPEETRAEMQIVSTIVKLNEYTKEANKCAKKPQSTRDIYVWSLTEGLFSIDAKQKEEVFDPEEALQKIMKDENTAVYVFRDFHKFFDNVKVLRLLRDIAHDFKQKRKTLILLSPVGKLPPEIEHDITIIEFELPTKNEITTIWNNIYNGCKDTVNKMGYTEDEKELIVQGAMGLTSIEAENAFSKAIMARRYWDGTNAPMISRLILKEKAQIVKKSGILEYYDTDTGINDIGGLDILKRFFKERSKAYTKKAREKGLPTPRGIVLVGPPGCGKSLAAQAASNIFGVPLIRFDLGRIYGGIIGQSEANVRNATQTIDAIGNCIVFIDEMEKAFAGGGNNSGDSGVSARVFGHLLTWMQEKKGQSFCVGTVNRIENILSSNPELLRKGRFDEIFFVGLPSYEERKAILDIHIRALCQDGDAKKLGIDLDELAKISKGHSGAELKEAVISGLYKAFDRDMVLNTDHIHNAIINTNPLSKSASSHLENMTKWAMDNAVNASRNEKNEETGSLAKFNRSLEV